MRTLVLMFVLSCAAAAQELNPDQLLKSAIDAQQRGDFDTAIRDYHRVLELRPNMVEAQVNLGAALARVGQFDEAIAMYKAALPSLAQKTPVIMNIALAYYKKGDFENARQQFEALHEAQPSDVRFAILLADTHTRLGKAADAVSLLAPMEQENSENLDFEYGLGAALIKNQQRREGVSRVEKVAQAGNSADAYMLAGATRLDLNEFEQASHDLDAALELNAKLPGLYTLIGTVRDKSGDLKGAEAAFREALKANPDDFQASLYLGTILLKQREMDEARIYLDRAMKLQPADAMVRYESAMLKSTSGQYEAAAADLENLIKDTPDWLEPHVELASLYYRLHRPADGVRERQVVEKLTAEQQIKGPTTAPAPR